MVEQEGVVSFEEKKVEVEKVAEVKGAAFFEVTVAGTAHSNHHH